MNGIIKRGEIYLYDFGEGIGSIQGGERPVVVLQSDDFTANSKTVIVAAVTSVLKRTDLYSHILLGKNYGLKCPSMILLEQMITVEKSSLKEYVGIINNKNVLQLVDKAVKKVLDIYNPKNNVEIHNRNSAVSDGVSRGEIYIYDFGCNNGVVLNDVKPVIVIQNDTINSKSPTTIVAAISFAKRTYLPSHIFINNNYGLNESSVILLDQIAVVNQSSLTQKIGVIKDNSTQMEIYKGLKKTMGVWNKNEHKSDIMCLCGRCLQSVLWDDDVVVKRADPFQKYKDRCLKCDGFGFDYIISRRNGGVHNG